MMSKIPLEATKQDAAQKDLQFIRLGLIAELDAVNFYEQIAFEANDPVVKEIFLKIAKEEKTHISEFATLLLENDEEQVEETEKGEKEVEEVEEEE